MSGEKRTYTYDEVLQVSSGHAAVLRNLGVGKGDRVVIYMPSGGGSDILQLACARLGAVHSVVFAGLQRMSLQRGLMIRRPRW